MAEEPIRIFSDIHFGDRASRVQRLAQLQPLTEGVERLVLNGDTLDTRPGPYPEHTAACQSEVSAFIAATPSPITFLTGNHDPDLSAQHSVDLAGGEILVLHGDVLFDDIVPWGRDARLIRRKIAAAIGGSSARDRAALPLDDRFRIWRDVAASIPQRHQSERNPLKYAFRFAIDTVWPPTRFFQIINAWRFEAHRATALARQHRPTAKYVIIGHTHRPAIRQVPGGPIVINTGSFTPPLGGYAVDILRQLLRVRRIEHRGGRFHPGPIVAEFPLANH